jgi:hypothetical protein
VILQYEMGLAWIGPAVVADSDSRLANETLVFRGDDDASCQLMVYSLYTASYWF